MSQETLKFKYRPKQFKSHLYGGIAYLIFGIFGWIFFESNLTLFFLSFGVLFIISYYYFKNLSYVLIDDRGIKVTRFIPKRIRWEDYKGMRFYVGDIRVLSKNKTIDINKEFLIETDIQIIEEELKSRLPSRNN